MRRALLEHTEGVTVRLVRLIEALAVDAIRSGAEKIDQSSLSKLAPTFPRPHGKRCSSAEAPPRRAGAVYRLAAKIY
jgi:hypothetical protein